MPETASPPPQHIAAINHIVAKIRARIRRQRHRIARSSPDAIDITAVNLPGNDRRTGKDDLISRRITALRNETARHILLNRTAADRHTIADRIAGIDITADHRRPDMPALKRHTVSATHTFASTAAVETAHNTVRHRHMIAGNISRLGTSPVNPVLHITASHQHPVIAHITLRLGISAVSLAIDRPARDRQRIVPDRTRIGPPPIHLARNFTADKHRIAVWRIHIAIIPRFRHIAMPTVIGVRLDILIRTATDSQHILRRKHRQTQQSRENILRRTSG